MILDRLFLASVWLFCQISQTLESGFREFRVLNQKNAVSFQSIVLPRLQRVHCEARSQQFESFLDTQSRSPDNSYGSEYEGFHKWNPKMDRLYGDGSKPWYLVNPKIAGKWMFIPLKMYL